MAQSFGSAPDQPGGGCVGQNIHALEEKKRQPPVSVSNPRQDAGQQSKKKAVGIRVVDPMISDHRILLPLWNFRSEIDVRVLMIVNLLPASIDVAKDVG